MKPFDRLHDSLQHHIVNTLQWRDLRPLQNDSIDPILDGKHVLLLAPTAGGKTEAAIFPTLSQMASESWEGLSVLYLCPIRALLNNLQPRLQRYASFVGARCAVWHGDVDETARKVIRREPPNILLTTPESVEAMLISRRTDHEFILSNVRAVIVDEIHAFAGDDRGWHLLAVLERLVGLRADVQDMQRIGLSATVGNPPELLDWFAGHVSGERLVINPPAPRIASRDPEVELDYVGSLDNAAEVISRLHRGEKRLVFCDSRARVENLARALRQREVDAFVSHSSLSAEKRRQAEQAFAEAQNCVIVATSALELGIDVGDLDRVIQIDAPATVASFLQRMGRTGRRADGVHTNCLFLATKDDALIQAAALIRLWQQGFVESVEGPPLPLHVAAQQILGLHLQDGAMALHDWEATTARMMKVYGEPRARAVFRRMIEEDILAEDHDVTWLGEEGTRLYGKQHFMDVCAVFTSPPLYTVLNGRREVGFVDYSSLFPRDGQPVLLLGAQAWLVKEIDWNRHVVHVLPTDLQGRPSWLGDGVGLGRVMCESIRAIVTGTEVPDLWTRRTCSHIASLREEYDWIPRDGFPLLEHADGRQALWTFLGKRINFTIARIMQRRFGDKVKSDNLCVTFPGHVDVETIRQRLAEPGELSGLLTEEDLENYRESIKFSECLPESQLRDLVVQRHMDQAWLAEPQTAIRRISLR